jgi:hypothetical protein
MTIFLFLFLLCITIRMEAGNMCMPMLCTTKTENGIHGVIMVDIDDCVILDLIGLNANNGPVARPVHIIDIVPLDLIWA